MSLFGKQIGNAPGGAGAAFTPATPEEINTGTDNEKVVTPLGLAGSNYNLQRVTATVATNVGTKQALLGAVPVGKVRVVTGVYLRNATADLSTYAGEILGLGFNAGASDYGEPTMPGILTIPSVIYNLLNFGSGTNYTTGSAGEVFGCLFAVTSVTATLDIDVFYYDVDA